MGKRFECEACKMSFPMTELHIDPETSQWYCDPCWQDREQRWSDDEEVVDLENDDDDLEAV